jgi:hypothetical protein
MERRDASFVGQTRDAAVPTDGGRRPRSRLFKAQQQSATTTTDRSNQRSSGFASTQWPESESEHRLAMAADQEEGGFTLGQLERE